MNEILIVDDNLANLDLLGRLLRERGHKVRAATSGRQALDSARLAPPDLILLDITMPEMDGYETCKIFKSEALTASIPIVFISAMDDPLDKVKAFSLGGEDYITKPFQAEEVLVRVAHQLRLAALQKDLKERNRSLEEAYAQLKELNDQKNKFFGIVAHDLRNPLGGIVLAAQLLQDEEEMNEVRKVATKIASEGMEMSTLIGRFLDIAAIESGKVKAEPEIFELGAIARHIAGRHTNNAARKDIGLILEAPTEPVYAFADLKFSKEVLDNLISNGVKFSPSGTLVTIRVENQDQGVRVSVCDQGPGLTEEDRKRLFGRFACLSAKPTGGEKSTGLGLSIVKHMVDAMDGKIWVESEAGQGATFHVVLPTQSPCETDAL